MRLPLLRAVLGALVWLTVPAASASAAERVVRFLAFGDGGFGTPAQYAVGVAMGEVCRARGCDFALMLGDNIYPSGVTSARDPQFEEKFERPYAPLQVPMYAVLGNHDLGDNGGGHQNARGQFQVDYHYRSDRLTDRWRMPARYYRFAAGADAAGAPLAEFFGLDSSPLWSALLDPDPQWDPRRYGGQQLQWLRGALAASRARWKIALSHHPYVSNGLGGNAGNSSIEPTSPAARGWPWKGFVEKGLCQGGVDLLISGHDHDLQWLKPVPRCGRMQFVVSGAVSAPARIAAARAAPYWQVGRAVGFFWFELREDRLTGAAYTLDLISWEPPRAELPRDADGRPRPAFEQTLPRQP